MSAIRYCRNMAVVFCSLYRREGRHSPRAEDLCATLKAITLERTNDAMPASKDDRNPSLEKNVFLSFFLSIEFRDRSVASATDSTFRRLPMSHALGNNSALDVHRPRAFRDSSPLPFRSWIPIHPVRNEFPTTVRSYEFYRQRRSEPEHMRNFCESLKVRESEPESRYPISESNKYLHSVLPLLYWPENEANSTHQR